MPVVSSEGKSGQQLSVVHRMPVLHVRLGISPADPNHKDDKFTLSSASGEYKKTLTVKDDTVPADEFIDLIFDHLKHSDIYTLEITTGGTTEKLFENVPYQELIEHYSEVEGLDGLEGKEEENSSEEGGSEEDESDSTAAGEENASPTDINAGEKPASPFDTDAEPEEDEEGGVVRNPGW